ncbi:MAG: glycolate oxidase subunit GlcE, partial [Aestuariibacter sp.]|nr:glycolate oxidase subunit GlcE [Aestuariibacter sp.]
MATIEQQDLEQAFQDQIRTSVANAQPVQIVGNGSKAFYGNASEGEYLEVSGHSGVIDYDPAELVITLRGGCKL